MCSLGLYWAPLHPGVTLLYAFGLSWAAMIDIDRLVLPDAITLSLVMLGLAINAQPDVGAVMPYILGCAAGYLSLAVVEWAYRLLRGRAGLGLGDAKLFAASGALLGVSNLAYVMLGASLVALLWIFVCRAVRHRETTGPIPFGPFLAASTWLVLLLS